MVTVGGGPNLRDRLVDQAAALPIANQATLFRVAELCRDPHTDARAIAAEAQHDEIFAATLLRLANSSWSASVSAIGDLHSAVSRLGLRLVESLALATPVLRLGAAGSNGLATERQSLHRHAVRTGLAARALAPVTLNADEALAAGLVHNIGLTILSVVQPAIFRLLLDFASNGWQLRDIEDEQLGFTHAELGGLLAERWRFPVGLITVIMDHDHARPTGMSAVVRLSDLLVREAGVGVEAPEPIPPDLSLETRVDPDAARERLGPLFDAETRRDGAESDPSSREADFAGALDAVGG
jgi:HD-like signal output (HDOD) protein